MGVSSFVIVFRPQCVCLDDARNVLAAEERVGQGVRFVLDDRALFELAELGSGSAARVVWCGLRLAYASGFIGFDSLARALGFRGLGSCASDGVTHSAVEAFVQLRDEIGAAVGSKFDAAGDFAEELSLGAFSGEGQHGGAFGR